MSINLQELKNKIVAEATKEIGYKEGKNNWNKFAVEANAGWVQNAPWCGTFNVAIYKRAGINLLKIISNPFYVPTMYAEGRAKGIWVPNSQIEAGDLILNEFNNDSLRDHTEISIGGKSSIGGNTSNGASGSQSDGGGVFKRTRPDSLKRGALSLRLMAQKFPQAFNQTVSNIKLEVWESSARIKGMTTAQVKELQTKLVKAGYSVGKSGVDGSYKKDTTTAVKEFQKKHGVTVDGVAGPNTIAKLDAVLKSLTPTPAPSKPAAKPVTASKPAASKAPAFPLPKGFYYGSSSGPVKSVSGRTANSKTNDVVKDANGRHYSKGLKQWQAQMKKRGWKIDADGRYGDETAKVVKQFQKNKKLGVDGKVGPATWAAAWNLKVT